MLTALKCLVLLIIFLLKKGLTLSKCSSYRRQFDLFVHNVKNVDITYRGEYWGKFNYCDRCITFAALL